MNFTAAARGKTNPFHNRLRQRAKTGRPTPLTFKKWVQPNDKDLNSLVKDGKAHCPRSRDLPMLRTAELLGAGILLLLTDDQSPILPCVICDLASHLTNLESASGVLKYLSLQKRKNYAGDFGLYG